MKNPVIASLKRQIEAEEKELERLKKVKEYLLVNFVATRAEQDAVFDVIAQIADRREMRIKNYKSAIISAM